MSTYAEWEERQNGFHSYANQVIESLQKNFPKRDQSDFEAFVALTEELRDFTDELFTFFLEGFSEFFGEGPKEIQLVASIENPPEYVLQKILQQAYFDLTVIQRLSEQRRNTDWSLRLKKYDQLALSALSIAFPDPNNAKNGLIDPVRPFVYFQRETSVRIIPYANIVLIGVPFSTASQPIDLLSIPHEIGHHVYETGQFSKTKPIQLYFEKYFADQPAWLQNWLEEIFADLYGFLVAGPLSGFSLQEILLDNDPSSLWEDDEDHPVGIIRPLIFSELFNSSEFNNGGIQAGIVAQELAAKWDRESKKRGFAKEFRPATETQNRKGSESIEKLSKLIKTMYDELNANTGKAYDFPACLNLNKNLQPWSLFPGKTPDAFNAPLIDPKDPFSEFAKPDIVDKLIQWQQGPITKMQSFLDVKQGFVLSRKAKNKFWLTEQIAYWKSHRDELPGLYPDIWKLIFMAFNWAEQGPDETRPV